jgi:uncharacterized protein
VQGLTLLHEPPDRQEEGGPWLAGHWHPKVRLSVGRKSETLPCFFVRSQGIALPSFGSFTGGRVLDLEPGDQAWVTAGACVFGPIQQSRAPRTR